MKVIIAGGRNITGLAPVRYAMQSSGFHITEIVSGGANGVDASGEAIADQMGIPLKVFKANWAMFGRAAGPIRNREMAEYADALILVWDGKSAGSADMKKAAIHHDLQIHEHIVEGRG